MRIVAGNATANTILYTALEELGPLLMITRYLLRYCDSKLILGLSSYK